MSVCADQTTVTLVRAIASWNEMKISQPISGPNKPPWHSSGWHYNIFCTPIFILGQDESQGTTTLKGWSKVKLPFGWTRVNLTFYVEYGYCTS